MEKVKQTTRTAETYRCWLTAGGSRVWELLCSVALATARGRAVSAPPNAVQCLPSNRLVRPMASLDAQRGLRFFKYIYINLLSRERYTFLKCMYFNYACWINDL